MLIRGFDKETMKKFFNYFVEHGNFENRKVTYNDKGNVADLVEEGADFDEKVFWEDERFKSKMATLYIKTFFQKKPEDFKTPEFQTACKVFNEKLDLMPDKEEMVKILTALSSETKSYYSLFPEIHTLFENAKRKVGFAEYGLSGSVGYAIVENSKATDMRIYVNPSQKEYRHFLTFLQTRALQEEICLSMKTRMAEVGTRNGKLDNLILYMSKEEFPVVVKILHEYEMLYPTKVAMFGGLPEGLARTKVDWFGFGIEPQCTKIGSLNTFNDFINQLFVKYILPLAVLEDFGKITENIPLSEKHLAIQGKDLREEDAKLLAEVLSHGMYRRPFLKDFADLSHLEEDSNEQTKKKESESSPEYKYSAMRIRTSESETDEGLISYHPIKKKLLNGKEIRLLRWKIATVFYNPEFRKLMKEYYQKHPEVIEEKAQYMLKLFKYIGESSPYLDDNMPFLSKEVVDAFKTMGIELTADADEAESTI